MSGSLTDRLRGRALAVVVAVLVFVADFVSKRWAEESLAGGAALVVAPVLRLVYGENTGIAFGWFAGGGGADIGRWLLVAFTAGIVAVLLAVMWRAATQFERVAYALIVGGAAGNITDRIRLGYVVDFIDAHWQGYHWHTFNLADAAITTGAALIIYTLITAKP